MHNSSLMMRPRPCTETGTDPASTPSPDLADFGAGIGTGLDKPEHAPEPSGGPGPKEFGDLPPELRFIIYQHTWEPRRVPVGQRLMPTALVLAQHPASLLIGRRPTLSTSDARLPVTLWVYADSRKETLKHYRLAFASPDHGVSHIYFNPTLDTFLLEHHGPVDLEPQFHPSDLAQVQRLAVLDGFLPVFDNWIGHQPDWLFKLFDLRGDQVRLLANLEDHEEYVSDEIKSHYGPALAAFQGIFPHLQEVDFLPMTSCSAWAETKTFSFAQVSESVSFGMYDLNPVPKRPSNECYECEFACLELAEDCRNWERQMGPLPDILTIEDAEARGMSEIHTVTVQGVRLLFRDIPGSCITDADRWVEQSYESPLGRLTRLQSLLNRLVHRYQSDMLGAVGRHNEALNFSIKYDNDKVVVEDSRSFRHGPPARRPTLGDSWVDT